MKQLLEKKLESGYKLNLSNLIETSFVHFKKTFLTSALGGVLIGIVYILLYGVLLGLLFGFSNLTNSLTELSLHPESINVLVGTTIFSTISAAVIAPASAGFMNLNHLAKKGESFSVNNLFDFYKNKYAKNLVIAFAIIGFLGGVINAGLVILNLSWLAVILRILIGIVTVFTIPLIIYSEQNYSEAIIKSIILFLKQPFIIIIALIIGYFIAVLGIIGLCIGIIFTLPYIYSMYYTIYDESIGFNETLSEIDEIGSVDE